VPAHLVDQDPVVSPSDLLTEFVPPPQFAEVSFDTYMPDPTEPTQRAALAATRAFGARIGTKKPRGFLRRGTPPEGRPGLYLDGGFGVGKTHLLASLWFTAPGPKTYGTFVEYTNLVGALGFRATVDALRSNQLVCIDEFELDDPGDTVLMSTLLGTLVESGVMLAATSNTLPDRLGEERFASDDFLREIQGLSAHFDVVRIDGPDYRHRETQSGVVPKSSEEVVRVAEAVPGATLDTWSALQRHLATVHPSRYGHMVAGTAVACLIDVQVLRDQAAALRMVVLIDRLYDREIPVVASGVPLESIFAPDMLRGGYRKKYFRALSRLMSLAQIGQNLVG
jgi:cell division protein ZapE